MQHGTAIYKNSYCFAVCYVRLTLLHVRPTLCHVRPTTYRYYIPGININSYFPSHASPPPQKQNAKKQTWLIVGIALRRRKRGHVSAALNTPMCLDNAWFILDSSFGMILLVLSYTLSRPGNCRVRPKITVWLLYLLFLPTWCAPYSCC